jgi:hypothetical protein
MLLPKTIRVRSEKHRRWVAGQACVVCGRSPCQAAHVGKGGLGLKECDSKVVPLCVECHREQTDWPLGEADWWFRRLVKERICQSFAAMSPDPKIKSAS